MFSIILALIYLAFISLGLPDSLLGAALPSMAIESGISLSAAGLISMIISCSTIISSLYSDKLILKLGTGRVCALSVMLTAFALLGFSLTNQFPLLCILAIPYGLGAGAVDVALNNYVALNYSSGHMKRLHCFWGIGAALGAYIMGFALGETSDPRSGYSIVCLIQMLMSVLLFSTLSKWKNDRLSAEEEKSCIGIKEALGQRGVKPMLIAFFGYCAFESTAGLWAGTYLAGCCSYEPHVAAGCGALLYIGITIGRFIGGYIPERVEDGKIIRAGELVAFFGLFLMLWYKSLAVAGLFLIGLGASPIYPSLIHMTPRRFGRDSSARIVGLQMASAYVGSTLIPPLFGFTADILFMGLYPYFLLFFMFLLVFMTEKTMSST